MKLRLGIDTGGTFTDAVLFDAATDSVVRKSKSQTTRHNLIEGIALAIGETLIDCDPGHISMVSLSTTLATNALVEGHGATAALLLAGYRESQLKLADLDRATRDSPIIMIAGGHDAAGNEAVALDIRSATEQIEALGNTISSIALSSMFSVRNPSHELALRDALARVTEMPVTCGHELSASLDAPRRALTALINAKLIPLIRDLILAATKTLQSHGIDAPLMVVRGDGSLVSAQFAERSPVETILSGPAASVIGAQFLVDRPDMLVSDIGGTTTDVALIKNGQPKLSSEGASVNSYRTMVRAVKIETHGLGGDSEILYDRVQRKFTVGPNKVIPLCVLASRYPKVLSELQQLANEEWTKTNMARFIVLRKAPDNSVRLTQQQASLVGIVREHPQSMQSVFSERHFTRALERLIELGFLTVSGFTPTDAAHVCGVQAGWDTEAATVGATLLSRYSKHNLGDSWPDPEAFCKSMLTQVSTDSALCLMAAMINDEKEQFGKPLHPREQALLKTMFAEDGSQSLGLQARLSLPVVGIGAPAQCFYPPISDLMQVEVIVPEHAEVANALGAVVGRVRQTAEITISPLDGSQRVVVHAKERREFDDLEDAAAWATEIASTMASAKATDAGGIDIELVTERHDNVVEDMGHKTFFESTIIAIASGRIE